jgi:hypothetical protein
LNLLAFGYVDNEDVDWWSSLVRQTRSSDGTEPRSRSDVAIKGDALQHRWGRREELLGRAVQHVETVAFFRNRPSMYAT